VGTGRPGDLRTLEVYDPTTDSWSTGPPVPLGRSAAAGASFHGLFVVLGGEHPGELGVDTEVDGYDPRTRRWTRLPSLPHGRQGIGATVIGNVLYLPGGGPVGGGSVQSNVLLELTDR
jgi:hypothetical protein